MADTINDLIEAVVKRIFQISDRILEKQQGTDIFENIGKASIEFAREYPMFFRELLLQPNQYINAYESVEKTILESMAEDPKMIDWTQEEKRILLLKMRIFQVGLQVMVANSQMPSWLEDTEAESLLMEVGGELQYVQVQKHKSNAVKNQDI